MHWETGEIFIEMKSITHHWLYKENFRKKSIYFYEFILDFLFFFAFVSGFPLLLPGLEPCASQAWLTVHTITEDIMRIQSGINNKSFYIR